MLQNLKLVNIAFSMINIKSKFGEIYYHFTAANGC
jgi:hypothetical protein